MQARVANLGRPVLLGGVEHFHWSLLKSGVNLVAKLSTPGVKPSVQFIKIDGVRSAILRYEHLASAGIVQVMTVEKVDDETHNIVVNMKQDLWK